MSPTVTVRGLYRDLARRALSRAWQGPDRLVAMLESARWARLALRCTPGLRIPADAVACLPDREVRA